MKVHLIWLVITIVAAAAWGQVTARSRETEFRDRERVLQVKVSQATSAAAAAAASPTVLQPVPPAAAAPAENGAIAVKTAIEYEIQPEDRPSLEELRKMIQVEADAWRAYQVLQKMVKSPLKAELLQELLKCKEPSVRRAVLYLLQETLESEALAPILQKSLGSDESAEVRQSAAQMLGMHGAAGTVEALLQAFQKDELNVQISCAAALNLLGQAGPASQLIPRFAAMLDSPDGAVRRQAVEWVGEITSPQAIPILTRALHDTNGDVRLGALNSLWSYIEDTPIVSLVEPLLNDPVLAVRNTAKEIIDQAKNKKE